MKHKEECRPPLRKDGKRWNRSPSRMKKITEVEAAWIGSMIEGEGSVIIGWNQSYFYPKVVMVNTDPEIHSVFLRILGMGSVHYKKSKIETYKPCFVWNCSRYNEVIDLLRVCKKYSMKLQELSDQIDTE